MGWGRATAQPRINRQTDKQTVRKYASQAFFVFVQTYKFPIFLQSNTLVLFVHFKLFAFLEAIDDVLVFCRVAAEFEATAVCEKG